MAKRGGRGLSLVLDDVGPDMTQSYVVTSNQFAKDDLVIRCALVLGRVVASRLQ